MKKGTRAKQPAAAVIRTAREDTAELDTPFAEGRQSEIDEDLRHRLISDIAYGRYCARGYADGYDVDDWLEAEGEVDHMQVGRIAR